MKRAPTPAAPTPPARTASPDAGGGRLIRLPSGALLPRRAGQAEFPALALIVPLTVSSAAAGPGAVLVDRRRAPTARDRRLDHLRQGLHPDGAPGLVRGRPRLARGPAGLAGHPAGGPREPAMRGGLGRRVLVCRLRERVRRPEPVSYTHLRAHETVLD